MAGRYGSNRPARAIVALAGLAIGLLSPRAVEAQLDNLEFVGHNEENPFHLMNAEIVGERVYISEGLGSLAVETYQIADPSAPIRIDQDGSTTWRTKAYPERGWLFGFGHQEGVQLYAIDDSSTVLSREYDPPAGISYEGGSLWGDSLCVAAHQIGIDLIDVGGTGPFSVVETIDLGDNAAWDTEVLDHYLIVANGRFGLVVVDLDLDPPGVVANVPMPGLANDIVLSGTTGFLSLGPSGLASFDLGDPSNPILLDHNAETEGNITSIDLLGDLLVAGAWVRLETYDVSDPSDIFRSGWDDTKTWAMGASLNDDEDDPIIVVADWRGISTYRPNSDSAPDIEIDPPRVDFGEVSTFRDTTVFVYNRGTATLDVETTDPFEFVSSPSVFSVPPGGVQEVTLTANGFQERRGSIRYVSNDPDEASTRQFVYKSSSFPQIGGAAVDFSLFGTDGQNHQLSAQLGKVVYLEFGANW